MSFIEPARPARGLTLRLAAAAAVLSQSIAPNVLAAPADDPTDRKVLTLLDEVVVTAPRMQLPLMVVTDPKQPRQPLPAHDGADYLKAIPGFSVIRKGGTDGDPVFRGMAASRVNISIDGQQVLGGCGMRMDPPTAYVYPEAYDRIVVIKGPQTVLEGPGNSAAAVRFERSAAPLEANGFSSTASALAGSFGRMDVVGDVRGGSPRYYGQLTATRAESDDYTDGDGDKVHSRYRRWNVNGALGWTPDAHTRVELSGARSDGEAAYADRGMDGAKFERDNVALRFERKLQGERLTAIDAQAYYNYVDHVMDNYSLRDFHPTAMMPFRAVSNPDRETTGGRILTRWNWPGGTSATMGVDLQRNVHGVRSTSNQDAQPYESMPREEDANFRNAGVFGEFTVPFGDRQRVIAGVRVDDWQAEDSREHVMVGMGMMPNPTAGEHRGRTLTSGFGRYERDLRTAPVTFYAGLGHVERFPDYWELVSKESATSPSAFGTRPERTTQLDAGVVHAGERLETSVSVFYSDVRDYVLIESNVPKGMRLATITRNVDATTWGGEADLAYALSRSWRLTGTLAYTHGSNDTDGLPLAQMPPLEARVGLDWVRSAWTVGALVRMVADQDRYVVNQGNIVGQDLGPTDGYTIASLNLGWKPGSRWQVTGGVDNLFDRTYAEHLSRAGAAVAGYEQTVRVNEPGRTLWLKVNGNFGG
jgi:iron complex outermembrane receptor protein